MNAPPQPPTSMVSVEVDPQSAKDWTWYIFNTVWGFIPLAFAIIFSSGAGYLSYQRNQSMGWALIAFVFATVYYPYYAFTSNGPVVSPVSSLMSAGRRMAEAFKKSG